MARQTDLETVNAAIIARRDGDVYVKPFEWGTTMTINGSRRKPKGELDDKTAAA